MKKEIWKPIKGTNFEASNLGRIRSYKILKLHQHKLGYMRTAIRQGTKLKGLFAHCLVAEAFFGPKKEGEFVNHKNCKKADNRITNLEYVTRKENAEHAVKNGRYKRKANHYRAKLDQEQVDTLKARYHVGDISFKALGKIFGVSKATANKLVRGKTWT